MPKVLKREGKNHYFDNFIPTNKNTFWEPCGNPPSEARGLRVD